MSEVSGDLSLAAYAGRQGVQSLIALLATCRRPRRLKIYKGKGVVIPPKKSVR